MATVFMKWLEKSPKDYDRGIQLLTLGRIGRLKEKIANDYVRPGMRVLEIGCGTGSLTLRMAQRGAALTAIDASPGMLAEAEKKIKGADLAERVSLKYMDAALIGERFPPASFDLIVSTLVFSELPLDDQRFVLEACSKLLAPGGRLLVADEVVPGARVPRFFFNLLLVPLVFLTWLITRTTTHSLRGFDSMLARIGLRAEVSASYLGGGLILYEAFPAAAASPQGGLPPTVIGRLQDRLTPRTLLLDLWLLFFRIIPPYPKVRTGLYAVGRPDRDSPVLVSGNFDLTIRRLVRALDGKVNVWLLVADSAGINVWCAAGGGYFTAEKVIAAVKSSHLNEVVDHHALILPQLCANGVDGWRIRTETGWGVHWGPVRAADIPAYLAGKRRKSDEMRRVKFPLKDRLEMVTVTMGLYGLLILLPVLIFWRNLFWPITLSMLGLSYFYAIVHPWLPGRDGLYKSIPLTIIALGGLFVYGALANPLPAQGFFHWMIGLSGLSVFSAAELQGMSPLMRGEQANWGWEAVIGVALGAIYWLLPLAIGWR
ncbi:MAG TPA: corrinoid protein-associated methyltransferase CpaM [Anaerolineales bacterium]|nr:corrinoid protein-associated methyltransferase CpaM [Anaerolineales bacterium]